MSSARLLLPPCSVCCITLCTYRPGVGPQMPLGGARARAGPRGGMQNFPGTLGRAAGRNLRRRRTRCTVYVWGWGPSYTAPQPAHEPLV
eukprot:gene19676-biopygen13042